MNSFMWIITCLLFTSADLKAEKNDDVWHSQESNVTISMRGLCAVSESVCWASGAEGTVIRTIDGGETWEIRKVDGADQLDFRDIQAFDENRAVILSAGTPTRVYYTEDGGKNWQMVFEDPRQAAFYDAMAFLDEKNGFAFSDPIDGTLPIIKTSDGGKTWKELESKNQPKTLEGEAGFAASGTCLIVKHDQLWIGLGGEHIQADSPFARIVVGKIPIKKWDYKRTSLPSSKSSGIFSLTLIDDRHGVAVGGDYLKEDVDKNNVTVTDDGGENWRNAKGTPPSGYRSAVAFYKHGQKIVLVAVGPNGTDVSDDFGENWERVSDTGFHALSFTDDGKAGWAVGSDGRVARFNFGYRE